ncbi:MAG: hypothetical protein WD942_02595 [Dehalococcoidia bacterium]
MKIRVHGEMTIPEIRQAIYEQLARIEEDFAVRYSRGATLFINPTNGFGDDVKPIDRSGEEIRKLNCRGPYRSAADEFKL